MKKKVEVGLNSIMVKDYSITNKFENHIGLRVNYLFRNKAKLLLPYVGAEYYCTINCDGMNLEDAVRVGSIKCFTGLGFCGESI